MTDSNHARQQVDQLLQLMELQPVGDDHFVAQSDNIGTLAVFGGQVLGQSLQAANLTLPDDRPVHSMHAYFLLPGEHAPIDYEVTRVRDGRSFSMRRVVARQGDKIIFEMNASFQTASDGIDHQAPMPQVAGPDGLATEHSQRQAIVHHLPRYFRDKILGPRGFEYRPVDPADLMDPPPRESTTSIWVRAMAPLPDDVRLHRSLLAYSSDHDLLPAAIAPHGLSIFRGQVRMASLDHAMWFHRDFRLDDWLLYVFDSPSASGARGLCQGRFYTQDGKLVASVMQEGMIRPWLKA
ncbi:MAG: acyl-CoA thioesterase II [Aquabacterium sp.]|nr:acyl-CoA thioesterase II [Aquabacterium sp.]